MHRLRSLIPRSIQFSGDRLMLHTARLERDELRPPKNQVLWAFSSLYTHMSLIERKDANVVTNCNGQNTHRFVTRWKPPHVYMDAPLTVSDFPYSSSIPFRTQCLHIILSECVSPLHPSTPIWPIVSGLRIPSNDFKLLAHSSKLFLRSPADESPHINFPRGFRSMEKFFK